MTDTPLDQIPVAKQIVCFWKQNDLGLYGRRADRWIAYWNSHPEVERVWVVEAPVSRKLFDRWLDLGTREDVVSSREFVLLANQLLRKQAGLLDAGKVRYVSFLEGGRGSEQGFERWLLKRLQSEGLSNPLVVLWPLCFVSNDLLADLSPACLLTDIVDDQRQFKGNQHRVSAIQKQYEDLLSRSDCVVSNSPGLIEAFEQEFLRSVNHVPNQSLPQMPFGGAELSQFAAESGKVPGRKVAGYAGNLRERIDIPRLLELMAGKPDWDFWFVGQVYGSEFYKAAAGVSNCRFFGAMELTAARRVMEMFDVAMVPFEDNALTQRMSLLKLEEYARLGKPVWDFRNKNSSMMGDDRIRVMGRASAQSEGDSSAC